MNKVTLDYSKAGCFIADHEIESMKTLAQAAKETLVSKSGAGNDFLGWVDLPVDYDKEEFGYRNRGFLSGCESGYRIFETQFLQQCLKGDTQDSGDLLCWKQYQQSLHQRTD